MKNGQPLTREEELLKELGYLRAVNENLKKFQCLNSSRASQLKQKARTIME